MTPQEFIKIWRNNKLSERAGAQPYFNDLCDLLGVDKPVNYGIYQFEYGASKVTGGDGWADVWKDGCFGWENKKPGRDLKQALKQLLDYSPALGYPPLLVVCDRQRIEIHTAFNGYPDEPRLINLDDIGLPENLQILRWVFNDPEKLRPAKSSAAITEEAAGQFAALALTMQSRGEEPQKVAHFLNQCLFCMFAEDQTLLPDKVFTNLLVNAKGDPVTASSRLQKLFTVMRKGGDYGDNAISWFNGGLFKAIEVPKLTAGELESLTVAARDKDWRAIEPAIFGTLFERGLNPSKRSQLGAHYTDTKTIMRIIDPVIISPLAEDWENVKLHISEALDKSKKIKDKYHKIAQTRFYEFLEKLRNFVVLDPACGSGNFLYLALKSLKDLEKRANLEAEMLGLQRQVSIEVSPANVRGIELDPYAAELARVTVWIGEIQWMLKNGYDLNRQPILKPLDHIENRDALLDELGNEASWPQADVIVGNPPFLGSRKMIPEFGETYVTNLRRKFSKRVPKGADFVCFWFGKAWDLISKGELVRVGLVGTNSITGGSSRKVLEPIASAEGIIEAWPNEPWVLDGASVRVAIVTFSKYSASHRINGQIVPKISADLRKSSDDFAPEKLLRLNENQGVSFQGIVARSSVSKKKAKLHNLPSASFVTTGQAARDMLVKSGNPNGLPNSAVVLPLLTGDDITARPLDRFIVNFSGLSEAEACQFAAPYSYIEPVKAHRALMTQAKALETWWQPWRPRDTMRAALKDLSRFIVVPATSKYRIFKWSKAPTHIDHAVIVFAKSDDVTFGILHSKIHELWSLRTGTTLEDRPRYTPTTCFETFPFPEGLTPNKPMPAANLKASRIAKAAVALYEARERWLNPNEWTDRLPEVVPGFPERVIGKPDFAKDLKKRTLTNLYNERPQWLSNLHEELDQAVAAAYGWEWPLAEDEILLRLFKLNQSRGGEQVQLEEVLASTDADESEEELNE